MIAPAARSYPNATQAPIPRASITTAPATAMTRTTPNPAIRKQSRHGLRQRLERAAELYLRQCYAKRTAARADEFADRLRLTRPYLSRVVPDVLGVPLRDFLRERQLAYAQHLLKTTPLSTVQVALA